MLCLARMIQALSPPGGSLRSHTDQIAFLVPGDACRRGTAFGYGPVRLKFWQQKKLRTVTGAVICRKDLMLIHDRDMLRQKAKGERRALGPMRSGSCNWDAVAKFQC